MNQNIKNAIRRLKPILPASAWLAAKKIFYSIFPGYANVSGRYRVLKNPNPVQLKSTYENTWKDSSIPTQQLKVNARTPKDTPVFESAVRLVRATGLQEARLLEIGCSTGYYADVFKGAGLRLSYEGCDYSDAFVAKAKELHPGITFKVEDATHLTYATGQFDIAISGCCILHIIDYDKAIAETARVAKQFALFHRTPVLHNTQTTYAEKIGYGLSMFEIFFNETELFELFKKNGLEVVATEILSPMNIDGLNEPVLIKSYLCKKI